MKQAWRRRLPSCPPLGFEEGRARSWKDYWAARAGLRGLGCAAVHWAAMARGPSVGGKRRGGRAGLGPCGRGVLGCFRREGKEEGRWAAGEEEWADEASVRGGERQGQVGPAGGFRPKGDGGTFPICQCI